MLTKMIHAHHVSDLGLKKRVFKKRGSKMSPMKWQIIRTCMPLLQLGGNQVAQRVNTACERTSCQPLCCVECFSQSVFR